MLSLKNHVGDTGKWFTLLACSALALVNGPAAWAQAINWAQRHSVDNPGARYLHAMAYDSARNRVVLYGGYPYVYETWEWDDTNWRQIHPANSPGNLFKHAMAYDSARGKVVLFGGDTVFGPASSDTWVWDGNDWTRKTPDHIPPARQLHAMAYDSARGFVVLFGGAFVDWQVSTFLSDTWVWDGSDWTEKFPTHHPPPLTNHAMAYDSARGFVVLFGGVSGPDGVITSDTWEWDGNDWNLRAPAHTPSPLKDGAMAFDSTRNRVVLFGGYGVSWAQGTWEWNGNDWIESAPADRPPDRSGAAMVFDRARRRVVLFGGGYGQQTFADTWQYPGCPAFVDKSVYGRLLFPPLCTSSAALLTQDVYGSVSLGIYAGSNDKFFLSSTGGGPADTSFSPLLADDAIYINGAATLQGPYSLQPGVSSPALNSPIEWNFVPVPSLAVASSMIPTGQSTVAFELRDPDRTVSGDVYGNTAVYLVRDCGIWLDKDQTGQTRLSWVSQQVQVGGSQSNLDVVSGRTSQLHVDHDFSRACFLGTYTNTTQVADTRPSPPQGDGYYYLVSGTCASPIGYGNSTQGPRVGLPGPGTPCPP